MSKSENIDFKARLSETAAKVEVILESLLIDAVQRQRQILAGVMTVHDDAYRRHCRTLAVFQSPIIGDFTRKRVKSFDFVRAMRQGGAVG